MRFYYKVKNFHNFYFMLQDSAFITDYIINFDNISAIKLILFRLCCELVFFHNIFFTIKWRGGGEGGRGGKYLKIAKQLWK